jgi:hypothetical protein
VLEPGRVQEVHRPVGPEEPREGGVQEEAPGQGGHEEDNHGHHGDRHPEMAGRDRPQALHGVLPVLGGP